MNASKQGHALGSALVGLTPHVVKITARGAPLMTILGLPEAAAREAKIRVRSALATIGCDPGVTCDVTVEDMPEGADPSALDLPIAVAVLRAAGREVSGTALTIFCGEIALDGRVRAVRGALCRVPSTTNIVPAIVLPVANAWEVGLVASSGAFLIGHLSDVLDPAKITLAPYTTLAPHAPHDGRDLFAPQRKAFDACLASSRLGSRGVILVGPPGAGKIMIARRLASSLALDHASALDVVRIYGAAGLMGDKPLSASPPFRAPHHTVSDAGLIGGGDRPRPGEVTLAHHGVLYLDELSEFRRSGIEALAFALEAGEVAIHRKGMRTVFPARPKLLVASSNPCACGYLGTAHPCTCSASVKKSYAARLDGYARRLGLARVEVPMLTAEDMKEGVLT